MSNRKPDLSIEQILAWADAHLARTGAWPTTRSGRVRGAPSENWETLDESLHRGRRGLPAGSSLARLLLKHRGKPMNAPRAPLSIDRILQWADEYRRRTGNWPGKNRGRDRAGDGLTWTSVEHALNRGRCGIPGHWTLARLLALHRGKRNPRSLPPLVASRILKWAAEHKKRTGRWPTKHSGPVHNGSGDTWAHIDTALHQGQRGLPGGSTLAKLLNTRRNVRNVRYQPPLTIKQILIWADAYRKRTGAWPAWETHAVAEAPEENWPAINEALHHGRRGLPKGGSLRKLLAEHRDRPYRTKGPPLTITAVLRLARLHRKRTGRWPSRSSGPVIGGTTDETWKRIDNCLKLGMRGLPGGSSLTDLFGDPRPGGRRRTKRRRTHSRRA